MIGLSYRISKKLLMSFGLAYTLPRLRPYPVRGHWLLPYYIVSHCQTTVSCD